MSSERPPFTVARRAAAVLLLVAMLGGLLAAVPVRPASAANSTPRSQVLQWANGTSFLSTGANAELRIDLGRNAFVDDCPAGFPDVGFSRTDIYIVPSGSVSDGAVLQDVSGMPNTTEASGSVFISEFIGYTAPTGDVGEGDWAVVYDECQNGRFDASTDALFDPAIRVTITADVPPLPGIDAMKAAAHEEALIWADFAKDYTIFLNAAEVLGLISGGTGIVYDAIVYMAMGHIGSYLPDVKTAAIMHLLNNAKHYEAIAADPPDPAFAQPTTLTPRRPLEAGGDGPMLDELLAVAEATASEAALAEALLHSMERYQGADQAADGDWALVHARALQDYATLLGDQMAHTSAAVTDLLAALDAQDGFENHVAQLEALRSRVVTSGYTDAELRAASAAGIDQSELDGFRASLADQDFSGFTEGWVRALLADLQASHAAMPAVLDDVALAMQPVVDWLVTDPGTEDLLPVVEPGGPYTGEEGIAIGFDASASTSATPITSYEWDLDADGEFDDATGATPTHTFTEPFDGLVGVRVTNAAGANVGYAHLTVVEQDTAPAITAAAPATQTVRVNPGATQPFSVTATDAEEQLITTTWRVDGVEAGSGSTFGYQPTAGDLGLHTVAATVSDGSPIGGSTTRLWSVIVERPDADGDGWADNLDCDDTDAAVNPGADEVIGNGLDDDCDPATPDAGSPPTVSITAPGTVVAGEAAAFSAAADDADGDIVSYAWDFGDGTSSNEAAPSHTFATPGPRTVSVTVTDEQGDTATDTVVVTVLARPVAGFTATPSRPQAGQTVVFTDTSSDADGAILGWSWDFGDGTTSIEQHPAHVFASAGTHEVRLTVVDDHGLSSTATVSVRVAAPGVAAFTTAKHREALDGVPGAGAIASSVFSATATDRAVNAVDGLDTTYWRSATAPAAQQDLRFMLPSTAVVNQLRLSLPNNDNAVRGFHLQLSTSGSADTDFTTVLTAEATRGPGQTFSFPPTTARYARLVVLSNHGGTTTQVGTVSLTTRDREGGIVSMGSGGPTAAISDVTSEFSASQRAAMLLDGSPSSRWRTADGTLPQSVTVDLATQSDAVVDRVVLTGLAHTSSARAFEVQVASSADPATFSAVVSGELPMTATPTTFTFPATAARRVRVVLQSNWGYADGTQLADVAVLDRDGINVASATAPGNAAVVDVSSQVASTPARNAIDYASGTYWGTPSGTTTGDITVRLRDAQPYLVDRVDVRGNTSTSSVRDVEIQVSNTTSADGAFVTVASGTVPANGRVRAFAFPAVEARYVRLVAVTNHGGATVQVNELRVWSPTRGGETVAFDDLSVVDGTIATWAWDFGDGTTSTEQHPVHTYAGPGTYQVVLTVTDTDGHTASATMPYTVVPRPAAAFTWTPAVPAEQTSVAFKDASTGALEWRYVSDAFTNDLTGQNPTGVFPDDGAWPVTLHIVDAELRAGSATNTISVTNRPPTANAGVDRTVMWGIPLTVDAQVGDPSPRDALTLACDWDFGDGQTAHVEPCDLNSVDVAHAYSHPGTYTATLTVSDDDGGVASDTRQVVVTKRPSFVQVVGTETVGGNVVATVRVLDGPDVYGIEGVDAHVAHGTGAVTVTTGPDGFATATLPKQADVATVEAGFAGTSKYEAATTVSKDLLAAPGDIVFIIDESGSMAGVQDAVRRNLFAMARTLGEQIDFRIGIVGFGGQQQVEIHLPLTDDLSSVYETLEALVTTGSFEPGYHATVAAMSDAMGYRAGAGACGVLIGDELPQRNTGQATREDAINAARARGATMFGIVSTQYAEVRAGYGPDPGSLTYETGGDAFDIAGFATNPTPVLDALLDKCVERIIAPGVGVSITGTPEQVNAGGTVDYTVTIDNDSAGSASGVAVEVALPSGLAVLSASDGGSVTPGSGGSAVVAWPAFTLRGNEVVTRTFTARVVPGTAAGPISLVATVADDGTRGPDRDPSDNAATVETVVVATLSAPVVEAGPDIDIVEGGSAQVAASFTDADDPATASSHTATIDWGSGPEPLAVDASGSLAIATAAFTDDASVTVEVCVTDDDGLRGCDSTVVTVSNAAPSIAAIQGATVVVGTPLVVGPVPFTDAGQDDTHTALVNFGDGSNPQGAVIDPVARTVTASYAYASPGTYTVSACVTDDDGASSCTAAVVTVAPLNQPPVAEAGGPYTTAEGTPVTLDASGSSDPDGDALSYAWDLDGDGAFDDASDATVTLSYPDDASVVVRVKVTDPSGFESIDTAVVEVANAAPVIRSVEALDGATTEELAFVVHFTDAGAGDTHTATVDVDGRRVVVEDYVRGTRIVVPVDGAGCTVGIEVEIRDDDGGADTASTTRRTARGTWLSPLRIDGSARSVVAGQVLPVKVRLDETCSDGVPLAPAIRVRQGDGVTPGGVMSGPELTLPSSAASQTRGVMARTGNHFQYDLQVDLAPGVWTILVYPDGTDGPSIRHLLVVG